MFSNSLWTIKIDRNILELWQSVCAKNYKLNISEFVAFIVRIVY